MYCIQNHFLEYLKAISPHVRFTKEKNQAAYFDLATAQRVVGQLCGETTLSIAKA